MQIEGSRVLLTGASGGLGKAIARGLHDRGAHLVLTARRQEVLDDLAGELGDRAETIAADLADRDDVAALAARAGRIDVLVHNAALPGSGPIGSFTPEQLDRVIDVNLRAAVQLTHALLPGMLERDRGQLVLVSSIGGKQPTAGGSIYAATKYALRGFGGSLRDDLHGTGVGVTTIFPGVIEDEGMWGDAGMKTPRPVPKRYPRDVAAAVVRAIEENPPEIDVADPLQRAGAIAAALMPKTAARLRRLAGVHRYAEQLAEAQKHKR